MMRLAQPRLAARSWLRLPRRTARLRLTALYGGLFLLSGVALLASTYVLLEQATQYRAPHLPKIPHTPAIKPLQQKPFLPQSAYSVQLPQALSKLTEDQRQLAQDQHRLFLSAPQLGGSPHRLSLLPVSPLLAGDQHQLATDQHQLSKAVDQLAEAVHQVAQSGPVQAAQRASDSHELLVNSGIALAVVGVLALLAGWLVAGRMLRPIRTITRTARRISSTSLHERLALDGPQDELKELGDTLDDLFGRLDAAFEAQRRFVANASHELRTPLTRERALVQVALGDPSTSELWRATGQELLASNREQEALIEALLTLASSESGLERRERTDLAEICETVLARPGLESESLGLQVEAAISSAPLEGDPRLIERLVRNLIDNAIAHNLTGGRVEVSTESRDGKAVLSVRNSGRIIEPAELDRLFQPFQRLDPRRTRHKHGHGLGLSIVRAIATAHHAPITAHSSHRRRALARGQLPASKPLCRRREAGTNPAVRGRTAPDAHRRRSYLSPGQPERSRAPSVEAASRARARDGYKSKKALRGRGDNDAGNYRRACGRGGRCAYWARHEIISPRPFLPSSLPTGPSDPEALGSVRLAIQTKLFAAFGVVVALMVVLGGFAIARLRSDDQHLNQLASSVVPSTRAVGDFNALINTYRKDQLHYIVAKPSDRPLTAPGSIAGDLANDLSLMRSGLRRYRSQGLIADSTDRRMLDTFQADFYRYVEVTAAFRSLADRGQILQAGEVVGDGPGDHEWDTLKALIASWNDHHVRIAQAAAAASRSSYDFGVTLVLVLLAIALAAATGVAVLLARTTTRALREIATAAKAISSGDIDQHVTVRSTDEFGQMATDFDAMIDYLRETVTIAKTIAAGNLDVEVRPRSSRDALGNALVTMTESLRRVGDENDRLLATSREEANTDALTRLPNRRALIHDLDSHFADTGASGGSEAVLALFDLDGFKEYNDTFGHLTGDALLTRLGDRLRREVEGFGKAYRMGGDEFCILARTDEAGGATIAARAARALSEKGEAFAIGCSYGVASLPQDGSSAVEALGVADDRMYDRKTSRLSASRQSINVLLTVLGERSPGLVEHLTTVAELAVMTAERLALPEPLVKRIKVAAALHDIGKVALPETLLNKPGSLDKEEWEFMRRHTEIGERIINAAPSIASAGAIVRSSHERYDGHGYPDQLTGDEIPIGSSIIAVCDAFDAMTSRRPYCEPVTVSDTLAELRRCSGSQFDPEVVRSFCELIEESGVAPPLAA